MEFLSARLSLHEAIESALAGVLERAEGEFAPAEELLAGVDEVISFVTWDQIAVVVRASLNDRSLGDESVRGSVTRLAESVVRAIEWHT